jgi:hypothetical protein
MQDDTRQSAEDATPEAPTIDWAELRARAAKLGITLSQLQQQEKEKKLRLAKKSQPRPTRDGSNPAGS